MLRPDEGGALRSSAADWVLAGSTASGGSQEVNPKNLSIQLQQAFAKADKQEWDAIVRTGAIRVLRGREAELARTRHPNRILSGRLVRQLKPQPGVGTPPKCKSRWCVLGHQDPDTADLKVYAPTPGSEAVLAMLQVCASKR